MEPNGVWPAQRRHEMLSNTATVEEALAAANLAIGAEEGPIAMAHAIQRAHDIFCHVYEGLGPLAEQ